MSAKLIAGSASPVPEFDVAVVGAGPVGASLACALGQAGAKVAVLEASPVRAPLPPSYDDRPLALAHGSRRILEAIGAWQALAARATPIREIHVSERGGFGVTRIEAAATGVDALGHVIPARDLGESLAAVMAATPGLDLRRPAEVTALDADDKGVTLRLRGAGGDRRPLRARLVAAADGVDSPLRAMLGIRVRDRDYRQRAITANVSCSRPTAGRAFERFTPTGPLALLPLGEHRCALVWAMPEELAEQRMHASKKEFVAALAAAAGGRLGDFTRLGERVGYPLRLVRALDSIAPRAVILGNAAHNLHPVAGQGLNLGLRDAAVLAEVVSDALCGGADPGEPAVLARYRGLRRGDQRLVTVFTDTLVRAFSNASPGLRVLRDLGLLALDLTPALKDRFAAQAMGRAGFQGRLSLGLPL